MKIKVTARHFKAHETLIEYVEKAIEGLEHYYDGILKADVVLSFEKARNSDKIAEIELFVYGAVLTAKGKSDDYKKSVDSSVEKILTQLKKYKDKLHKKDRIGVRKVREKE